ncbi:MAG: hypothetical protein F2663_00870 [Actinobacteria bacterium]|uniref:Unannotated protein n=1 Tax=freshwater metagenome TaxID=449393 RepID=A0A6J6NCT1_9ZZZZ|nr:hypothetical protein [Actinomycetota bacterium]
MKKLAAALTLVAALAFSAVSFAADSPTTTTATAPAKGGAAGNGALAAHLAQIQDRASKLSAKCAAHPNPKCTARKAAFVTKLNDFDAKLATRIAATTGPKKLAKLNEAKTAVDSLISSLG